MLVYALKSALCLSLFYVPYMLLLCRESFFRFNRFLLLGIMLLSAFLPLFDIHLLSWGCLSLADNLTSVVEVGMPVAVEEAGGAEPVAVATHSTWSLGLWLLVGYIVGAVVVLLSKVYGAIGVYYAVTRGVIWKDKRDKATIYCHAGDVIPFSVFGAIVINEDDWQTNSREIITHEMGHVVNRHSWDVVLLNAVQVVQWFNPLAWHMSFSLRDVHEYEADDCVLCSGVAMRQYQTLLIRKAVGSSSYAFANSFNHSLIKKRLTMMLREKSNPWMLSKSLYVIPVALVALSAFATSEKELMSDNGSAVVESSSKVTDLLRVEQENSEKTASAVTESLPAKPDAVDAASPDQTAAPLPDGDDKVFDVVEVMPSYEGGMPALMTFLAQNVRYPKIAQSNGVSGRVIVQFVVEKDGHVTDVHVVKSKIDKPVAPKTEEKAADTNDGNAGASAACTVVSYSVGTNDGNAAASTVSEEDYAQSVKALEDEAVRVVNLMRSWKPGKQNGAPVRVKFCVPLTFRLN